MLFDYNNNVMKSLRHRKKIECEDQMIRPQCMAFYMVPACVAYNKMKTFIANWNKEADDFSYCCNSGLFYNVQLIALCCWTSFPVYRIGLKTKDSLFRFRYVSPIRSPTKSVQKAENLSNKIQYYKPYGMECTCLQLRDCNLQTI